MNGTRLPTLLSRGATPLVACLDTPAPFAKRLDPLAPPVRRTKRLGRPTPSKTQQLRNEITHLERVLAERHQHAVTGLPLAVRTVCAVGDMVGDKENTCILKNRVVDTVLKLIQSDDGVSLPLVQRPSGAGISARLARQDTAALTHRRDWLCNQIKKRDAAIRYMVFFVEHGTGLLERSLDPVGDLRRESDTRLRALLGAP